jgi:hypothetical protein
METVQVRKEFILEGYAAACDGWKARLIAELPEVFEKKKPTVKELIEGAGLNSVYGYDVVVLADAVLVPLPNANDEWTWEAFEACKKICELLKANEYNTYPVFGEKYTGRFKSAGITDNQIVISVDRA